jgi:hypothetical protein
MAIIIVECLIPFAAAFISIYSFKKDKPKKGFVRKHWGFLTANVLFLVLTEIIIISKHSEVKT